ncbi:F-box protein At2g02240-like [Salvia miltiorrhiza]|uniref:F-box protein At2g02240-like n=1 Tax=Salvia miltiorrhiza TaxID=226208 RepID=UPI0025ACF7E7|nr:F-box protein At2g02240-like [Salvia miltiorrhiza]
MEAFATLPEETVSEILSRTCPLDASRFATISKGFKSAAEADYVWGRFLPSDWPEMVSRSAAPVVYSSMKDLYFRLCHSPITLDAGRMIFWLEKRSGKKCYLMGARELGITWAVDTPWYWEWTSHPDSRFSEVAQLQSVCWLDIRGKINTRMLSPHTKYGAYLVFKLAERCNGLRSANAVVRFVNEETDSEAEGRAAVVHLQRGRRRRRNEEVAVRRSDGWMEIEMGSFCSGEGDERDEVEARLMEIKNNHWKSGLIVEGIHFRPKLS